MTWLDANPDVKGYTYECVIIEYVSNVKSGRKRKYFPDFLVEYTDGRKQLVEVKPKRKLGNRVVQKKLLAALDWCRAHGASLEVVTEIELKVLGLL